jgi:thiamine-phosphate pyrophosphorylase
LSPAPPVPRLHVIVDVSPADDGLALAQAVLAAGAPAVQARAKAGTDRQRLALVAAVARACADHGATCLVDDRVDLALAVAAGGWHGGADDVPVDVARRLLGSGALVGGTARDPEAARAAAAAGASYLGVGPVYATTSKAGLPDPLGLERLAQVCAAVAIPVIAIAGVTAERVPEVLAAGAHGVAVIGAVRGAPDPTQAVRRLLDALEASP